MRSSESNNPFLFDHHTIRAIIGLIAMLLPWIVRWRAALSLDSISWAYHTDARDIFVGCLFVMGAFLISYKGHQVILEEHEVSRFWKWLARFWRGAIRFRIWERKHEEDLVGWLGGICAIIAALFPTAFCTGRACPFDPIGLIHNLSAVILFLTTAYFCLVAFRLRVNEKMQQSEEAMQGPQRLRKCIYAFCGWGIIGILVVLMVAGFTDFDAIADLTYWAELVALELFGFAWVVASQYLPIVTGKGERLKLF